MLDELKTCIKCRVSKPFSEFPKAKRMKLGIRNNCKVCKREHFREYCIENKADIAAKRKIYREKNKDKVKSDLDNWRRENKSHIKDYEKNYREGSGRKSEKKAYMEVYRKENKKALATHALNYVSEKRKIDVQFKLAGNLRARLNTALKKGNKSGSAVRDLGCSIAYFKQHLESQFQEGMSWKNYGRSGWHIDHIIPLSSFNLTAREQLLKACHYSNMQPLWAKDNLKKSNKLLSD